MFQTLGILGLAATLVLIAIHALFFRSRGASPADRVRPTARMRFWDRLAYGLAVLSILGLAATGLFSALTGGEKSLNGWMLWTHFAVAPLFIVSLLALVLLWADRCRFLLSSDDGPRGRRFGFADKVLFWIIATLGFVAIFTICLSMAPVFASEAQNTLYTVHRYSALLLTMALIGHGYAVFLSGRRADGPPVSPSAATSALPPVPPVTIPAGEVSGGV